MSKQYMADMTSISTNTLLAEGDSGRGLARECWQISTNTLLAEGDECVQVQRLRGGDFNQHPPRGG